jgi:hypothetical protein
MEITTSKRAVVIAAAVSALGLALASVSVLYIAGMFGLSTAFASQVVHAVEVGGVALAVVIGLLSAGIAGTVIATAEWAIAQWGTAVAVA